MKNIPLYVQIYQSLREEIRSGNRTAGEKLPSRRQMAEELGVSLSTVDNAYSQLVSEGFIEAQPQRGFFVCAIDEMASLRLEETETPLGIQPLPSVEVDFSTSGVAAEAFPYNQWRRLLRGAFDECDATLLDCPPAQGDPQLREWIARYLRQARGVRCDARQVVVGAGTEHLLQILSYLLDNRFTLAMEDPVYHGMADYFIRMGHPVRTIAMDEQGVIPGLLEGLHRTALYITPSHQFPLGFTMPIGRRVQLLNWAGEGQERYIIEDDYDSEFRYHTRPVPSLQSIDPHGRVIYLGTFSKSVAPSLRIGYMVLPGALLEIYRQKYAAFSSAVSGLEQKVLVEFLRSGQFQTHLNRMRNLYRQRREALSAALGRYDGQLEIGGEMAGHHLLVRDRRGRPEAELCQRALDAGVRVYPIARYFAGPMPPRYQSTVLLGYGALPAEKIRRGVEKLALAWELET
ncbi:MAG: PLP-dependent aminotransferase family protein [Eubacteriales bacterium]|jgi:GntR family transcriptional regulator/MocR family aminotransferase